MGGLGSLSEPGCADRRSSGWEWISGRRHTATRASGNPVPIYGKAMHHFSNPLPSIAASPATLLDARHNPVLHNGNRRNRLVTPAA
jgi:hypothetical protein